VAILDERVAFLEGRAGEQSQMIDGIRVAIVSLEQRMDRRFEAVDQRFTALEDKMDRRFTEVDHRIDGLDAKMSRQFLWLVGVQVTTLAAMVAALVAR
jgi:uncharacterized coiled-coil protein SlyX